MLIFLVILLLAAVFTDWKTGKIPNFLILIGSIAGILIGQPPGKKILGTMVVIIIFFPFYLIRALGAGDIKCIACVYLYLTTEQFLSMILYTFLTAAVTAVSKMICYKFQHKEIISLRMLTIHLAFPILAGVLLSTGGDLYASYLSCMR